MHISNGSLLPRLVQCAVVCATLALSAHADVVLPKLTAFSRSSPATIGPGAALTLNYSYAAGTNRVVVVDIAYNDPTGFVRHAFNIGSPAATSAIPTTVTSDWPNGAYTIKSVTLQDTSGIFVTYNRDGSITVLNAGPVAGPHSLDFSAGDFTVTGAGTASPVESLSSIARSSAASAAPGTDLTCTYAYSAGSSSVSFITLNFEDPRGYLIPLTLSGNPVATSGTLVKPITTTWINGAYNAFSVELHDSDGRTITYLRDGRVTSNDAKLAQTTHTLDFTKLDFTLAGATTGDVPPYVTSVTNQTSAPITTGSKLTFGYTYTPGTVSVIWVQITFADPTGVVRSATTPGSPPASGSITTNVGADWPNGSYQVTTVTVVDSTGRNFAYGRNGYITVTNGAVVGRQSHALNFQFLDFQVSGTSVGPASIVTGPQNTSVAVGGTATLSVTAGGAPPLTYQWFKDGTALTGATNATLTLSNAQKSDAGRYAVSAANNTSSANASAVLTVVAPEEMPNIIMQPQSASADVGSGTAFLVSAAGLSPLTYQWQKDGKRIAGATLALYSIPSAQLSDAGTYACVISNPYGTVQSANATLTVTVPVPGPSAWLTNVSVRTMLTAGQSPLIVGLTVTGGSKPILLRAVGPTLAGFGLSTALPDPRLDVFSAASSTAMATNDDWDAGLASTFASVGAFALTGASKDAALAPTLSGGYTAQAPATGTGTILVEAYDVKPGISSPRLTNLSARNGVGTGDGILIAGFSISGKGTMKVLIRAVGPKLADFGVTGALADPMLEVYDGANRLVASNDNWDTGLTTTFDAVGAFGLTTGSKDAAVVTTLAPGIYTVQVKGADGGTGQAIVEVYEVP